MKIQLTCETFNFRSIPVFKSYKSCFTNLTYKLILFLFKEPFAKKYHSYEIRRNTRLGKLLNWIVFLPNNLEKVYISIMPNDIHCSLTVKVSLCNAKYFIFSQKYCNNEKLVLFNWFGDIYMAILGNRDLLLWNFDKVLSCWNMFI